MPGTSFHVEAGGTVEHDSIRDIEMGTSTGAVAVVGRGSTTEGLAGGCTRVRGGIARIIAGLLSLFSIMEIVHQHNNVRDEVTVSRGSGGYLRVISYIRERLSILENIPDLLLAFALNSVLSEIKETLKNTDDEEVGDGANTVSGVHSRVLMWLMGKLNTIWRLLGIRQMNPLKTVSFSLVLVSFFVDEHFSLTAADTIYLTVAIWCVVLTFFVAPWRVPDANAPRLAQVRQALAVLTLIIGVLFVLVTALDEKKFRWLVLFIFSVFFLICICMGEEEEGEGD